MEWRAVRALARRITRHSTDPMTRVLAVARYARSRVSDRPDDPYFCGMPWLEPLGASPLAILRDGGCCSGRSRVCTLLLRAAGVAAHQITLYHRSGCAQHALVEARLPGFSVLLDPAYDLYYVDEQGRPLCSDALRAGRQPCFRALDDNADAAYPADVYYDFDFERTRTANWTRSIPRRIAYRILHSLTRGRIDRMPQPVLLEWPQLVLAMALLMLTVVLHVAAI